jgi:hypothetical protein
MERGFTLKTNILKALINLDSVGNNNVSQIYQSKNRINSVGESLEYFIKDIFCDSFNIEEVKDKEKNYSNYLSYSGNQNNPPDFIIENGDAVEVKKIQSQGSNIALNSSFPKDKLYKTDSRITKACKNIDEEWDEKDIIYVIGVVKKGKLKLLWLVYGDCYAADKEIYLKLFNGISDYINDMRYEFAQTNEIGKVKRVDPLGITDFRIRGMWHIKNPLNVFNYLDSVYYNKDNDLEVYAIMKDEKYNSFDKSYREKLENESSPNLKVNDVEIKNPNNPVNYINSKLIKGTYNF